MKKGLLTIFVLLFIFLGNAQDETSAIDNIDKNELKWNATNLIIFSFLDGSYEYLINEESSFGVGVLVNLGNDIDFEEYRTFSLTPYYRQFFSRKYAKGFFVEGFGMFNTSKETFFESQTIDRPPVERTENFTDFALGISIGGKFVTKRGFVAEIYAGIGRNLLNNNPFLEVVGRGGVSVGYRF